MPPLFFCALLSARELDGTHSHGAGGVIRRVEAQLANGASIGRRLAQLHAVFMKLPIHDDRKKDGTIRGKSILPQSAPKELGLRIARGEGRVDDDDWRRRSLAAKGRAEQLRVAFLEMNV